MRSLVACILAAVLLLALPVRASEQLVWKNITGFDDVKPHAALPRDKGAILIDSRPARRYDEGHIPTAINLPDTQFDKLAPAVLPADKSAGSSHSDVMQASKYADEVTLPK